MIQRYYYYISNGVDTQHVAEMKREWLSNVMKLLPFELKRKNQVALESLSAEMSEDYHMSVKKAIVDFVLKDPRNKNDEESTEYVINIRSCASWQQDYKAALIHIKDNLFINPTITAIVDIWHKFSSMRLFDLDAILLKGSAFELKAFKTMLTMKFEKAHEKLMTGWYPSILNVFYQGSKKDKWMLISPDRIQAFFRMISFIIADQLRQLIHLSLKDFVDVFDGGIGNESRMIENGQPVSFIARIILEDVDVKLEPSMNEIQSTVENFVDQLLVSVDRIPKIETQLFSNMANVNTNSKGALSLLKPEYCINVAFESTFPGFVKENKTRLSRALSRQLNLPILYLKEFDKHKSIIDKSSQEEVSEFLKIEQPQERYMEEIKKWRSMASTSIISAHPYTVYFRLVELHCDEFLNCLADRANFNASKILDKLSIENRNASQVYIFLI